LVLTLNRGVPSVVGKYNLILYIIEHSWPTTFTRENSKRLWSQREQELRVRRRYGRRQYCEWRRTPNNNHDEFPTTRVAFQSWRTTSRSRLGDIAYPSPPYHLQPPSASLVKRGDRQTCGDKKPSGRLNTTMRNMRSVYPVYTESAGGRLNKNKAPCRKLRQIWSC